MGEQSTQSAGLCDERMGNMRRLNPFIWFIWWKKGEYMKTQPSRLVDLVEEWGICGNLTRSTGLFGGRMGTIGKHNPVGWLIWWNNREYAKLNQIG